MSEIDVNVLSMYDIQIDKVYKGRDSYMVQSGKKLYKLISFNGNEGRANFLNELSVKLQNIGITNIDGYVANKEGNILTVNEFQEKYILKTCVSGVECDVKNNKQIISSIETLARLHNALNSVELTGNIMDMSKISDEYTKRCNELKRVKNFIRARKGKTSFEYDLLSKYDEFYEMACSTLADIQKSSCEELETNALLRGTLCHGNYNYHNVIIDGENVNIINFEKVGCGLQIRDLYFYMRKIMEKHNWNLELGESIIKAYSRIKSISQEEHTLLLLMIKFPEKFCKVVNQYYNNNKAWIPDKNIEKINMVYFQQQKKELFFEKLKNC